MTDLASIVEWRPSPIFVNPGHMERVARFFAKVRVRPHAYPHDCWDWIGAKSGGYGRFRFERWSDPAHRVSWEWAFGGLAKTLELHHRCGNRACVNPEHLQALTHAEHAREEARLRALRRRWNA